MGLLTQRLLPVVAKFCSLKWQTQTHAHSGVIFSCVWHLALTHLRYPHPAPPPTPAPRSVARARAHARTQQDPGQILKQSAFLSNPIQSPATVRVGRDAILGWEWGVGGVNEDGVFLPRHSGGVSTPPSPSPSLPSSAHPSASSVLIIRRRQFSKRHLNSDVNVLIRSVNELKAAPKLN